MADLAGEPLFFTAASEPVVPEPAEPVKSTPVQINNIYVESDRSDWWRYGRRVVIYPDRPPRPKPKPDKPGKPDDPDEPDKPDKPKKPGKSGTSPVFPSGSGTPRPIRWPSAPAASGNGSTGRYGLLPDWAAPGQTGAPVRSGK